MLSWRLHDPFWANRDIHARRRAVLDAMTDDELREEWNYWRKHCMPPLP